MNKAIVVVLSVLTGPVLAATDINNYPLPKDTLFALNRVNFKSEKTLIYRADVDDASCTLKGSKPISAIYIRGNTKSISYKKMGPSTTEYFGVQNLRISKDRKLARFTFKSLKMFDGIPAAKRMITVRMEKGRGGCQANAYISMDNGTYEVLNIQAWLKKLIGVPYGVSKVKMVVLNGSRQKRTLCVVGDC